MTNSKFVQIIKDQRGRETIMVRVDKTLKEIMEEKPSSRWDPDYWHPKWEKLIGQIGASPIKFSVLGELFSNEEWLISTDHVRASRGEKEGDNYSVEYYTPANLLFTGYDISKIPHCTENAFGRMSRARPLRLDLLLGGFGMGPTGKSIVLWQKPSPKAIVGNIFILRTKDKYSSFVLDVFFKSVFGQGQLNRVKVGVAINKLSNDQITSILVPLFSPSQVQFIESEYKKMSAYHDKAMDTKKKGDEAGYTKNIETAEKMLKDLIAKTEAVIRGEREDII